MYVYVYTYVYIYIYILAASKLETQNAAFRNAVKTQLSKRNKTL